MLRSLGPSINTPVLHKSNKEWTWERLGFHLGRVWEALGRLLGGLGRLLESFWASHGRSWEPFGCLYRVPGRPWVTLGGGKSRGVTPLDVGCSFLDPRGILGDLLNSIYRILGRPWATSGGKARAKGVTPLDLWSSSEGHWGSLGTDRPFARPIFVCLSG